MNKAALAKGYEPTQVEDKWSAFWDKNKSFTPRAEEREKAFSIVIPPPNVTGSLHMGHALNITLQDILCRYMRQKGYDVLWLPGTDHAGIATQNVVERSLAQEGIDRRSLGREEFVKRVWQWKDKYGDIILNQIRKMGASVDWTRQRFTMDDGLSRAVREVFVQLYEQGLIYQGNYIINWCPRCQTALADLEVEYEEVQGGLYHIRYALDDATEAVIIATTRPETMLGDTAVAVHPEDERYSHLIGKTVILPLIKRKIPIIADEYVDKEFGTGCLKVTPAHDPHDFELGARHGLEGIKVIDAEGKMTMAAGDVYAGMDRMACREKVVQDLEEQGLLLKKEEYSHNVGHCYRCHTIIEPSLSKQWFVATSSLASKAKRAVQNKDTSFFPSNWEKLYFEWMDNIRDWCISRQIWWGHRIPAWTCAHCNQIIVAREDPQQCPACGSNELKQDEDVLDTWFSSALWPFSTLGWPDQTEDLKIFYPTSILVTGFDIIFFWVARMMMMGLHFMPEVPFRHVYIHALVRDEQGKKMSKSTGNVIDPITIIDQYGADALRFTLTAFAAMGRDIKLSISRIEGYRHFINKIWNAARFALLNLEHKVPSIDWKNIQAFSHRFILHELEEVKQKVSEALQEYHFNDAAQCLYQFVWHTYCDWYLEMIKTDLQSDDARIRETAQACLHQTLSEIIILLHPFIPFLTQEIWEQLPALKEQDLSRVAFPRFRPWCRDPQLSERMEFMQEMIVSVRNIRSELNINPGQKLELLLKTVQEREGFVRENQEIIKQLAGLSEIEFVHEGEVPKAVATAVVKGCEMYVPLQGVVDFEEERQRLYKEIEKLKKELISSEKKLSNSEFLEKAPAEVIQKEKSRYREKQAKKEKLERLEQSIQGNV